MLIQIIFFLCYVNFVLYADAHLYSPELMIEEAYEAEQEAGSFSPELLHGDENEEAIDPEDDKAILVT